MTGRPYVKRLDGPDAADRLAAEAAGLRWLAAASSSGGCPVARVLALSAHELTVARVDPATPTLDAAEEFGRALARTHAAGADAYGSPPPGAPDRGWIAALPLPYGAWSTFGPFYARARVAPYLRAGRDVGALSGGQASAIDALCERLADDDEGVCGPPEAPARLHGDLWSGNVLWSPDGAVLIDPAAHGGHRETDLAMLALFGLPHLGRVLSAYDEVAPLAAGWRERVALHQVHPLLVHAVLFGGSYGAAAADAARRALAA